MNRSRHIMILIAAGLGVAVLAGCTYQGGDVNPFVRKTTWYSYLNGDDLRATCEAGQADSLRLVYNAIHTEQIRTYDITMAPDGENPSLKVRVLGPTDFSKLGFDDLVAPWRGDTVVTHLRQQDMDNLWTAMDTSGAFAPAPEGLFLVSEKFFWLTAICREGRFSYNAFVWPSDRFDNIRFDDLLFAWDMTDVAVKPPRQATNFDIYGEVNPKNKEGPYYQLTIGKNGLKGATPLFSN